MIVALFLKAVIFFLSSILFLIPKVTTLPAGIDYYLSQGMGYIAFIITKIPPLGILYNGFLIIMGFETLLFSIRFIPVVRHLVHKA
jgi:hypothetical protein